MRKVIFVAGLLMIGMTSAKQATAQDVIDAIAEETCSCTKANGVSSDTEEFQMQLGLCILQACGPYEKELKKQYNFNISDFGNSEKAEEFGMQVGLRMAYKCPELFVSSADLMMDMIEEEELAESAEETFEISGVITSVESDQFMSILIRDAEGRTHKLLWLTYFINADLFANETQVGNQVSVSYYEWELYNPAIKDYMNYKVIASVNFD